MSERKCPNPGCPNWFLPRRKEHIYCSRRCINVGRVHTLEQREKTSAAAKKNWQNQEFREKVLQSLQNVSQESRQRQAASLSRTLAENPEIKQKISFASKKNWQNPDFRKNMLQKIGENNRSEKRRREVSEQMKLLWSDPEFRGKMSIQISEAQREVWSRPGYKEKRSLSAKKPHIALQYIREKGYEI